VKTLLIIEDDRDIMNVMVTALKGEGYSVQTGFDVTALFEIEKDPPALILLDNWLDGKTGHDICYQLKRSPKTQMIPVLLVSATQNLAQTAASCGADGFLMKPFELEELFEAVARLSL